MITIDTEKWPAFMVDGQMIVNVPEETVIEIQQQRDKLLEALKAFMALDEEFSTAKRKHVEEIAQAGGKMAQAVLLARDAIAEVEASK